MNPGHTDAERTRLDYSSLSFPVSSSDIRALHTRLKAESNSSWYKSEFATLVFILSISILPLIIGLTFIWLNQHDFVVLVVLTVVVAVGIFSVYNELVLKPRNLVRLYRFADANKLTVVRDVGDPSYSGMIFDEGHNRQLKEAFKFPDHYEVGNYQYETGSGKNRQTHTWSYVKVELSRTLPHMVLDARQNNFLGMTNLPDVFRSQQELTLEGDFNEYFKLYAPGGYERDALYVFTPDVMMAMIDNAKRYDMEIIDSTLYIYLTEEISLTSKEQMEPLLQVVGILRKELGKQTAQYADERAGDATQNAVAHEGQRLKTGINYAAIALTVVIIGCIAGSQFWEPLALVWVLLALIGPVIIFGAVVVVMIKALIAKLRSS